MNKFLHGFIYAARGIVLLIKNERNFRIHFFIFLLVILSAFLLNIDQTSWMIILITSAVVMSLEAINTSIEKLCDLYTTEINEQIKKIKDISAGAVLIASILAAIIGILIFKDPVIKLLN